MDDLRAPAEFESLASANDGVSNCNIHGKASLGIGRMTENFHLNLVLWQLGYGFANSYLKNRIIQYVRISVRLMMAYHIQHTKYGLLTVAGIVSLFGGSATLISNAALLTMEAATLMMVLCLQERVRNAGCVVVDWFYTHQAALDSRRESKDAL